MEDLLEKVLAVAELFKSADVPHSFGGAIALGYYGHARGTRDIDINIYLAVEDADRALVLLEKLGVPSANEAQRRLISRDGQVRLFWQDVPLDLFFWNLDFHASCCERRREFPLLDQTIDVLSPEDLLVCKVAFARDKDARDISGMLDAIGEQLDIAYVLGWVESIVGLGHPSARDLIDQLEARSLTPAPAPS